jgi:type I restriction enzyme S subunit
MQLLLTGKKRLPGFSGEWEVKKLGDSISIATWKKDVNEWSDDWIYPFFTCSKKISYSNTYSFEWKTILIAWNWEVWHLQRYNWKFEAYQRTYVLQNFSINEEFLRHQLSRWFKKSLWIWTIGSTIPYIKKENITEYYFLTPPTIQEQTAIASTISDIDIEIQSLQQKKEKYTQIKQGMMQQLLTGKIRLV